MRDPLKQITKREAAVLLGVHMSSVHRMMDRGELTPVRTVASNGRVAIHLFNRSDVIRLRDRRAAA